MAKIYSIVLLLALICTCLQIAFASHWLFGSDKVYNAWHKSDLEQWLDDHDIPYPAAADRKDLHDAVAKNWDQVSSLPYQTWEDNRLRSWLDKRSIEYDVNGKKQALLEQVKLNWYRATDEVESSWDSVKDWIFDSWDESHLKEFLDLHGIPCPQPRERDTLIAKARAHYHNIQKSLGDTAAIPGNWIFEAWSDSDLKSWCDCRGIPVPQGSKRNELIALVRRNMRKTKYQGKDAYLAVSSTLSSLLTKATGSAATAANQATDYAGRKIDHSFNVAVNTWSESRLKAYLEERGVPVPHHSKLDELRALVRRNAYRARLRAGFTDAAFDTWSTDQLQRFLGDKAKGTRDQLIARAKKNYASASSKGGKEWASLTAEGAKATSYVFDKWSDSDLKSLLDSYGVSTPRDSQRSELLAAAKRHSRYFSQGPDWYTTGFFTQLELYAKQVYDCIWDFISRVTGAAYDAGERGAHIIKEHVTMGKHRVEETKQKAGDRVHEKAQQGYDKVKEEL